MSRFIRLSAARSTILPTITRPFTSRTAFLASKDATSLDADKGSVGSAFKSDGEVGSKADQVGGPFSKDGKIGEKFEKDGAVGGTVDEAAKTAQGKKPSAFDKDGMIGKHFTSDGAVGALPKLVSTSTLFTVNSADAILSPVGGPFAADGAVGKQFTEQGAVGGTVQENLGDKKPS